MSDSASVIGSILDHGRCLTGTRSPDDAQWRSDERLKDAPDPRGILSPGRQGIWPEANGLQ